MIDASVRSTGTPAMPTKHGTSPARASEPILPETRAPSPVLSVRNLCIGFRRGDREISIVEGVNLDVRAGETLAIVGESGCGKSVSSLAIMGLLPPSARASGQVRLTGEADAGIEILSASERVMRTIRGRRIAMIFQEPMTSLNPLHRVGDQIVEAIRLHRAVSASAAAAEALQMLNLVGIPEPARRLCVYPHEMSGGMRQRVMIAIALSCRPDVLIADEPTTALDVTIQAQILDLLARLQRELGMAIVFITHDLGVVAEIADRVMVMYAGRVVEEGSVAAVLNAPAHPYTRGLLASVPRPDLRERRGRPLNAIRGMVPDPAMPPDGCRFHPRCDHFLPRRCDANEPVLVPVAAAHAARCVRWDEIRGEDR